MKLTRYLIYFIISAWACAFAQPELTNTEATNVDTEPESIAWRQALDIAGVVKSGNFTAANQSLYTVVANATVTDPGTPAEGEGFSVLVRNGTATIGGIGYTATGTDWPVVHRVYHSGAWATKASSTYNPASVAITGGTATGLTSASATTLTARDVLNVGEQGTFDGEIRLKNSSASAETRLTTQATDVRAVNWPDLAGEIALTTGAQTLDGKTLTGVVSAGITGDLTTLGNIELGNASDTTLARGAAGRLTVEGVNVPTISSTDTLTNKTLTSPTINGATISGTFSGTLELDGPQTGDNIRLGPIPSTNGFGGVWFGSNATSPSASNYTFLGDANESFLNGATALYFRIANATKASIDSSGNFAVDTNTLYVDASNNRIGVGTSSPANPLQVTGFGCFGGATTNQAFVGALSGYAGVWLSNPSPEATITPDFGNYNFLKDTDAIIFNAPTGDTIKFRINNGSDLFNVGTTNSIFGNTIAFSGNSGTWNGATIAGAQTMSGQLTLTGQSASADNSAMTRGLVDYRQNKYAEEIMTLNPGTFPNGPDVVTGTGQINKFGYGAILQTGTTTGSTAIISAGNQAVDHFLTSVGVDHRYAQWDNPKTFSWVVTPIDFDSSCRAWCFFGGPSTVAAADLTAKGYAIKMDGSALKVQAHDGTTLTTSASLATLTTRLKYVIRIETDGAGGWECYLNNASVGSGGGGPTGFSGIVQTACSIAITNGAGTAHAYIYSGDIKRIEEY